MVWAPEALWNPDKGESSQDLGRSRAWGSSSPNRAIHGLLGLKIRTSRLRSHEALAHRSQYPTSDPNHTGSPGNIQIRYSHTADFKTFSPAQTYINKAPTNIIDLDILSLGDGKSFVRFMKDESAKNVFCEVSTTGLFGTWTRPGGASAIIERQVEGPAAYLDNTVAGKAHVLLDFYGGDGYRPYETTNPQSNSGWKASSMSGFPKNLRHGSVLPVNQTLYNALKSKWGA